LSLAVGLPFAVGTAQDGRPIGESLFVTMIASLAGLVIAGLVVTEWDGERWHVWASALAIALGGAFGSLLVLVAF